MTDLTWFNIKVYTEDDGSYYAEVLTLPWCFSCWETKEELNTNLKEAILSYLYSLEKDLKNNNFKFANNTLTYA
jgi:predicted RNase H-like HicB family nuclease